MGTAEASVPGNETEASAAVSSGVSYGVQILVLSRHLKDGDKAFKGYSPRAYKSGKMYKYVVGSCSSEKEAIETWRAVKRKFPDSFPVTVKDGKVSPL